MLLGRGARSAVADLVVELERTPPGRVREALARTLGDPSLELALWLPERESYVDSQGQTLELPAPSSDRAVTVLGPSEAPVAALLHDPVLLERRGLLEAAGAAARLALENERLQAELRAQLAELRASRTRIVQASDEERRRLERNLHDGAQQRLLSLGLALQLARAQMEPETNGATELLAEAEDELRAALDELRELARGIHPAILTDQGLGAALRSLAERSRGSGDDRRRSGGAARGVGRGRYLLPRLRGARELREVRTRLRGPRQHHLPGWKRRHRHRRQRRRRRGSGARIRAARSRPTVSKHSMARFESRARRRRNTHPRRDPVRVVIADDSVLLREGVSRLLADEDFDVVAKVASAEELLRCVEAEAPDVAVVDIRMPPTHSDEGLVAAETIRRRWPGVGVLVLSQYTETEYALRLLEGGEERCGYLLKDRVLDAGQLADAVRRVGNGGVVVDPELVARLVGRARPSSPLDELTPREHEVLALMAEGLTDRGIGERLFVTPKTVETHIRHIFSKLRLPETAADNKRVHAVLTYLRT